jgi:fructokinase
MVSGKLMHGLVHPEMGHIYIPHDLKRDPFSGVCPFHGDCLEGLATGPAMQKRWNMAAATDLPVDHPGWDLEAEYLAYAFANYVMALSPQKIIVGGGVMHNQQLYKKIRERVQKFLNGYIKHGNILTDDINNYIVPPKLGDESGIFGALALAEGAINNG